MNNPLDEVVFSHPRCFLNKRFVYAVISRRTGGLSIGINMNPDQLCTFDCVYCEVKRDHPDRQSWQLDVHLMSEELKELLNLARMGKMSELPAFANASPEYLLLKSVALSGDGEPTYCPCFNEVVHEVTQIRRETPFPPFKLILITNATGLHRPNIQEGLELFSDSDEIWAKLDAGTQSYMSSINQTHFPIERVLENIANLSRKRPVIIQSLFCKVREWGPSHTEIGAYIERLLELKRQRAQISLVQIYSVTRAPAHPECTSLPLASLSAIAQRVQKETGLRAEVY